MKIDVNFTEDTFAPKFEDGGQIKFGFEQTTVIGGGNKPPARISYIELPSANWQGTDSPYSQVVTVDGVTPFSKVDLLPSVEQLAIFHDKDVAFVTENEDGVVTVYAIGDMPLLDYTMQVQITEVEA